jgi:alpha-tubulin suppressor-like RCC1 family protein
MSACLVLVHGASACGGEVAIDATGVITPVGSGGTSGSATGGFRPSGGYPSSGGASPMGGVSSSGGATGGTWSPPLVAMPIAVGNGHACAVLGDGTVRCWGGNGLGQLGDGTKADSPSPVKVWGITDAVAIAAGAEHACVVLGDGSVRCWGSNIYDQLGAPTAAYWSSNPVTATGITDAVAIAAGDSHTCALAASGAVWCWGKNDYGQLGDGTSVSGLPVAATGITDAVAVGAGNVRTCAVLGSGSIECWGGTNCGGEEADPASLSRITGAVAVATDCWAVYAILSGGLVTCWGVYRELGNGYTRFANTPEMLAGAEGVQGLATSGTDHACMVLVDGRVHCWGHNGSGQLGNGSTDFEASADVVGIDNAVAVAVGGRISCALLGDGSVQCWGAGSLGSNTTQSSFPVTVTGF